MLVKVIHSVCCKLMSSLKKYKSAVKKVSKCKMFPIKTDTTLLIVESPSKCATIMKYLGDGYRCVATCGHMRYLDGLNAIDVNKNYKLKFTIMDSKKSQITRIESEIKMAGRVIIATDDDREGEAIAWHICDMFRLPIETTERIVFHEITKDALEKAIVTPRKVNMNIVTSSHARQILDLLIGYKISPYIWKHISSTGLSAGRCQTPALRLVYDNQREIENRLMHINNVNSNNSKNENIFEYSVCGYFTKLNIPFSLDKRFKPFFSEQEKNLDLELETFLQNSMQSDHVFMCVENDTDVRHLSPPTPFSTSRLQQTASNEFSISPSETMKICQTLYERGYITYIRTTGKSYSAEFIDQTNYYVREKWGDKYVKGGGDKGDIEVQAAHEAIRPTDVTRISLNNDCHALEEKMYKLIWKNALENCMSDYIFSPMVAKINASVANANYAYKFSCQKPIFLGWKALQGFTLEQQRHHTMMDYLHNVRVNSIIPYNKIETNVVITSSLGSHYTEARLIQALEEKEIGRPSTYSTIIEKNMEREYVKKQNVVGMRIECNDYTLVDKVISKTKSWRDFGNENNKLILTPIGKSVLEFLTFHFPVLFSYDYTRHMEMRLDNIASANGGDLKHDLKLVCDECVGEIEECIKKIKKDETQYRIDDHHIFIIGKHGPVVMYSEKPFPIHEEGGCYNKYLNAGINSEENESIIFKKVKPGLIFDDLKMGKYENLSEIIVEDSSLERVVGTYGGFSVILKNGRFGKYVVWGKNGENRKSFKCGKNISDISLEEIIRHIENDSNDSNDSIVGIDGVAIGETIDTTMGIVRTVNDDISIRKGKYGDYIFYKTAQMKKPKFISLKTFKFDYNKCGICDIILWVKTQI